MTASTINFPKGGLGSAPARLPGLQKVWDEGIQGKGVGIAIVDTGVAPLPDYEDRLVGWYDADGRWDTPTDESGHGSISAGCAAGDGKFKGVAPQADIVGVAVGSEPGSVERGLEWILENKDKHNIRVVNLSLGAVSGPKTRRLEELCREAVRQGLFVCASMGNSHPMMPALSPAILPEVVGVGAYDDNDTADPSDDDVASFSNRGDAQTLPNKPDLLSPGADVMVPVPLESRIGKAFNSTDGYIKVSGTSEASPYVAGLAALMFEANPELTGAQVAELMRETSSAHLAREAWEQGAGLVRADLAVEGARAASR